MNSFLQLLSDSTSDSQTVFTSLLSTALLAAVLKSDALTGAKDLVLCFQETLKEKEKEEESHYGAVQAIHVKVKKALKLKDRAKAEDRQNESKEENPKEDEEQKENGERAAKILQGLLSSSRTKLQLYKLIIHNDLLASVLELDLTQEFLLKRRVENLDTDKDKSSFRREEKFTIEEKEVILSALASCECEKIATLNAVLDPDIFKLMLRREFLQGFMLKRRVENLDKEKSISKGGTPSASTSNENLHGELTIEEKAAILTALASWKDEKIATLNAVSDDEIFRSMLRKQIS